MVNNELVKAPELTQEQLDKYKEMIRKRNLFVKYSNEELNDVFKVDLYEALDLDYYWGRDEEIPKKILNSRLVDKRRFYYPRFHNDNDAGFICITEAHKILSDKLLRKVYESNYLDETIPEDREYGEEEFFEIFDPIFKQNGMFSEVKPVPELRRANVTNFYNFWYRFKTTRLYDNPQDVMNVSRSTVKARRLENKDILEQKKQADLQRIKQLVSLAHKRDPRINKTRFQGAAAWTKEEEVTAKRLGKIFSRSKNIYQDIAKGLNSKFKTTRTANEVKAKIGK